MNEGCQPNVGAKVKVCYAFILTEFFNEILKIVIRQTVSKNAFSQVGFISCSPFPEEKYTKQTCLVLWLGYRLLHSLL